MTINEKQFEAFKKDINFLSRVLGDIQTEDYEAVDAMCRTLAIMDARLFEIELEAQPSTEDELIAA